MAVIVGTSKSETKSGTNEADTIRGLGGSDTLYGKAGDDKIFGGPGNDSLHGDAGNDVLRGEDGNDSIYGNFGNDVLLGGVGNDRLYGDAGTDTVKGEAGNDVIKGGTGISFLYGGSGNDQLYYDPTTSDVTAVGNYLSGSLLNGDSGADTLNIFTKATYTSNGVSKPAYTYVAMGDDGRGLMAIGDPTGYSVDSGVFTGIEKLTVTGAGGLSFSGAFEGAGMDVTGTTSADLLVSYYASDTMAGGGGNDTFSIGGGNDRAVSGSNDADTLFFYFYDSGNHAVTGFNGAGKYGGDRIYIDDLYISDPETAIVESGGKTTITLDGAYYGLPESKSVFVVDAVGLIEGVDFFIT